MRSDTNYYKLTNCQKIQYNNCHLSFILGCFFKERQHSVQDGGLRTGAIARKQLNKCVERRETLLHEESCIIWGVVPLNLIETAPNLPHQHPTAHLVASSLLMAITMAERGTILTIVMETGKLHVEQSH